MCALLEGGVSRGGGAGGRGWDVRHQTGVWKERGPEEEPGGVEGCQEPGTEKSGEEVGEGETSRMLHMETWEGRRARRARVDIVWTVRMCGCVYYASVGERMVWLFGDGCFAVEGLGSGEGEFEVRVFGRYGRLFV